MKIKVIELKSIISSTITEAFSFTNLKIGDKVLHKTEKWKEPGEVVGVDKIAVLVRYTPPRAKKKQEIWVDSGVLKVVENPDDTIGPLPNTQSNKILLNNLLYSVINEHLHDEGIAFIPDVVKTLISQGFSKSDIHKKLISDNKLELRPEGGVDLLSSEEKSLCVSLNGRLYSWCRVIE